MAIQIKIRDGEDVMLAISTERLDKNHSMLTIDTVQEIKLRPNVGSQPLRDKINQARISP